MFVDHLEPHLELLSEEYVLVQAWKKTALYIRYHNSFADTLDLDRTAVNVRAFIGELRERLQSATSWKNDPLRIVPAPKSQRWQVKDSVWEPDKTNTTLKRVRPLGHVNLADQVVATALALCLADRVETLQGDPDPWRSTVEEESRRRVVSYGNRLFCDEQSGQLRHRWGSTKLYRAYFRDYRTFVSRPDIVANSIPESAGRRVYIVHADLRQFYDRVHRSLLSTAVDRIRRDDDDPGFFLMLGSVLDWGWHPNDEDEVHSYADGANLDDFTRVVLPQGLVASGFFSNVVLLAFDEALRTAAGTEIAPGIFLEDSCRYVDDLRFVVTVETNQDDMADRLRLIVPEWLNRVLSKEAQGLTVLPEKTEVVALGGDGRLLVRQSTKMDRIQSAVSGGFDALAGGKILDSIQGLMRTQAALSIDDDRSWHRSPVPDVRDDTVARFGAARYRTTFRSIRPLLPISDNSDESGGRHWDSSSRQRLYVARTRRQLDDEVKAFALGLVQRWIHDPSNVRLLRIGLDLWPDVQLLQGILSLLRPFTNGEMNQRLPKLVAWYCLAEILRAGATETGFVEDKESLPSGIDIESYREELCVEAARVAALPWKEIPWYLRQQALLYIAVCDPTQVPELPKRVEPETRQYWELIRFLRGDRDSLRSSDFVTHAVLARRAFMDRVRASVLTRPGLHVVDRKRQLARQDPSFLLELADAETDSLDLDDLPTRVQEDLCRVADTVDNDDTLARMVLEMHPRGPLRNELSILRFAVAFLKQWEQIDSRPQVITPGQVMLKLGRDKAVAEIDRLRIRASRANAVGSLYEVPEWCPEDARWRVQLGFLMRFILSGHVDFTRPVRSTGWKEKQACYRPAVNHWYQRLYGLYSGQSAFGDDWLPITDWGEGFLYALLRWPGCRASQQFGWIEQGIEVATSEIDRRIAELEERLGRGTGTLLLPLGARRSTATERNIPFRACVVQTVIPTTNDLMGSDPAQDRRVNRRRHRKHLSAALEAVKHTLALRATHTNNDERLDWLILPELAVHPVDVRTHLVPFARQHKTLILAGLTYEEVLSGEPLINSALWIIPEWSPAYGLQIRTRRQGKKHLAPNEQKLNAGSVPYVQGFRPCQWLIGYPWSNTGTDQPIWLTASICYDATDLGLAADLRNQSDVLAIPALNKDVKTFDQMALALHYHMFQLVVVANHGEYGGSNAYWPKHDLNVRRIFHTHGQPQASISFLEIEDVGGFLARKNMPIPKSVPVSKKAEWKHPPAGLTGGSS